VDSGFDAVLQIGGWHRLAPERLPEGVLRCSYHDAILATYLRRPGLKLDPGARAVRRAWEAEQRTFDELALIFTMSDWVRESLLDELGQDPSKVVTVGAGANIPVPDEPAVREDRPMRFLFVGKGDFERKGGSSLVKAFRVVRGRFPDAELLVVGPERAVVDAPGVRWAGRLRRSAGLGNPLERVYRSADAFVMPSVYEPFGIAFLEAMAYGLPCIGSRACAMPEIIGTA
jgi:glycosyltransferase involved in cell wall biosynthesis